MSLVQVTARMALKEPHTVFAQHLCHEALLALLNELLLVRLAALWCLLAFVWADVHLCHHCTDK